MRSLCFCLLLALLAGTVAPAQEMLKVNLVELYDKVPPPPADAREAYGRCEHSGDADAPASPDPGRFYQSLTGRLQDLEKQLGEINRQLSLPATGQMKQADAEGIQKKMKSMSQAEKMKYAMELSKQMGLGPKAFTPEPAPVTAAIQEYSRINGETGEDMMKAGEEAQKQAAAAQELEQKHEAIEKWAETEEKKIPQISGGEMSWPEPKQLHALHIKTAEKHLAVENDYLKTARKVFQAQLEKMKKRYTPLQQKLTACNYGNDARNIESKRMLNGAQILSLGPAMDLLQRSEGATRQSAEWYARLVRAQNEKLE